jgi:hypothetical protein
LRLRAANRIKKERKIRLKLEKESQKKRRFKNLKKRKVKKKRKIKTLLQKHHLINCSKKTENLQKMKPNRSMRESRHKLAWVQELKKH